jgi:hypothetical protein
VDWDWAKLTGRAKRNIKEIEQKAEEKDRCRSALFSRMCGAVIRSTGSVLE